ncbi:MAG: SUMF1/EgtB/PvdO family nonheme iron enzyme [Cyclobacteriaceae bacterium]|nr:SUMF1/EgtB/PvdO family nonheme iron enzyme [Cyclobacteriaceae bacterium]
MRYLNILFLFLVCAPAFGQPDHLVYKIIPAPDHQDQWKEWSDSLVMARDQLKKQLDYQDSLYRDPVFRWAADCYHIYFLMLFDNAMINPESGRFEVEKFIANTEKDFGRIDGVVLWHAYPRIGVDPRNQFDHYRDFPGGLEGLRRLVDKFHEHGIRVFIDYNPWDRGTRREGREDVDLLVDIIRITGADGIFLDTLTKGSLDLRGKLDSARPGVVLESELALPANRIFDHHMSWAQWFDDSHVPGILWNKWFERRHMMHQIKRWDHDHTAELQMAWMNGSGMLIWENVFGTWMPWNERDKSYLRLMGPVQRTFSFLFRGEGWSPRYPVMMEDVFSSLWYDDQYKLWTVINRSDERKKGMLMKIPCTENMRLYDLFRGTEIGCQDMDSAAISIDLGPRGLGAILVTENTGTAIGLEQFLKSQKKSYAAMDDRVETIIPSDTLINQGNWKPCNKFPGNMVRIEEFPEEIEVSYMQRECGFYRHDGYIPPPDRIHQLVKFTKKINPVKFAIDIAPVTNAEYYDFMVNSGYYPVDSSNYLRHWTSGKPSPELLDHPVVYVSLEDARAYAEWAGKRLPSEEEWQLAAQGKEGLVYPWGNAFDPAKCNSGQSGGTIPVMHFPEGRSPAGCYDMCGNTWEWTESERSDGHTRYVIIKGGSWFKAEGSDWYFQGGPQPSGYSAKYILFWPGLDRSSTIGFRCVADVND